LKKFAGVWKSQPSLKVLILRGRLSVFPRNPQNQFLVALLLLLTL
jgi:hypothetical protein